ncbi:MAG: lamin tail domain-containing protein, partial [Flavobacteriaceae bacterium]|nr:lamin tail domain-containing protein [Flavobacteriaceae bacterium]
DNIPDIETTYISGNGNDVYELVDNTGARIDIFGVIGEDGNGTNWEYLDGRAVRKLTISSPNPVFTASEWLIYSAVSNPKITNPNSPQNAPDNFNPRVR